MNLHKTVYTVLFVALAPLLAAETISVEELADRLVSGDVPFLVDVRRSHEYADSHIPNAVSIPADMLRSRRLPPIGEVIVYGDGMGRVDMDAVMAILSEKPGIEPRSLDGGYASWNTRSGVNTGAPGLRKPNTPTVTYQDLVATGGEGVVVYDLRKGQSKRSRSVRLQEHFPRARMESGSPYALLKAKPAKAASAASVAGAADAPRGNPFLREKPVASDELIVLVDDDHASAEKMATRLRAGGFERVAVLAGGEMIIEFEGRPGLERRGRGSIQTVSGTANEEPEAAGEGNP